MSTILTSDMIEKEVKVLLEYNALLERDINTLRQDRSFQEKAHNAWLKHADAILEQQTKQTNIMENLLITLSGVLNKNQ